MKCFVIVVFTLLMFDIEAQITPNKVDSLGLKQGMWKEFKVPYNLATTKIGIKVPEFTSEYYYLTKDEDRKYFPIIECVGEYKDGLKTGVWNEYNGDGSLSRRNEYKEGVPFGECKMFWPNGVLKMEYTINSCDSVLVRTYDQNGDILVEKLNPKTLMIRSIYNN